MLNLKKYLIIFILLNLIINNKPLEESFEKYFEEKALKISSIYFSKEFKNLDELKKYIKNIENFKKITKINDKFIDPSDNLFIWINYFFKWYSIYFFKKNNIDEEKHYKIFYIFHVLSKDPFSKNNKIDIELKIEHEMEYKNLFDKLNKLDKKLIIEHKNYLKNNKNNKDWENFIKINKNINEKKILLLKKLLLY